MQGIADGRIVLSVAPCELTTIQRCKSTNSNSSDKRRDNSHGSAKNGAPQLLLQKSHSLHIEVTVDTKEHPT